MIVQPSLVFGAGGRSAQFFAMLASLPLIPLPGAGGQRIQPVHIDDLVDAVCRLLCTPSFDGHRIPIVGAEALTLRAFLCTLRAQLRPGPARFIPVPAPLARAAAALGGRIPGSLFDRDTLAMLERGNVADAATTIRLLGRPPRGARELVPRELAQLWSTQARLGWLLPLLRLTVAIVWLGAGIVSLGLYPPAASYQLLARVGISGWLAPVTLYGAALLDLIMGAGTLMLRARRWLWRMQIAVILGYSAAVAVALPEFWLHPFEPLLKNLPLLVAIVLLHELEPVKSQRWTT